LVEIFKPETSLFVSQTDIFGVLRVEQTNFPHIYNELIAQALLKVTPMKTVPHRIKTTSQQSSWGSACYSWTDL